MNVWTFTGNLGRDCSLKPVGASTVCQFVVAVTSGFGDRAETTWVTCAYWGKRGEAVTPYLNKGQQVAVSGEATLRTFEKKDKSTGFSLEVRVTDLTLVGSKTASGERQAGAPSAHQEPASAPSQQGDAFHEDDIPF